MNSNSKQTPLEPDNRQPLDTIQPLSTLSVVPIGPDDDAPC